MIPPPESCPPIADDPSLSFFDSGRSSIFSFSRHGPNRNFIFMMFNWAEQAQLNIINIMSYLTSLVRSMKQGNILLCNQMAQLTR